MGELGLVIVVFASIHILHVCSSTCAAVDEDKNRI